MDYEQKLYVTTAIIAAELSHAANIASEMSLIAKNARVIATRAGESAVGFKPITDFITDFAATTIKQANDINQLAISISALSITKSHAETAKDSFSRAWAVAGEDSYRDKIEPIIGKISTEIQAAEEEMFSIFRKLNLQLEESEMQIRAAALIATSAKTEASRAGDYQANLNVIAEKIEETSAGVRTHLRNARKSLDNNRALIS